MNEVCLSCGKPADVEIEPIFRPITARGERACELIRKSGSQTAQGACVDCLMKVGKAVAEGDFSEEEGP